ncbi:GNAT family N-acetyltransferase [archaeon]|nr:GNAT family N-acetyltransferase [archaeon]
MKIRKATKKDFDDLLLIDAESDWVPANQAKLGKKFREKELSGRFAKGIEEFFLITERNEPVGYAGFLPDFPGHRHAELYWLAVRERFQRQGYGKKLAVFVEGLAKKKGFRKMCLYTRKENPARKFYEALKFKKVNEFPDYYGFKKASNTAVLYCKNLK